MLSVRCNFQGFDIVANRTGNLKWKARNMVKILRGQEDYNGYFGNSTTSLVN